MSWVMEAQVPIVILEGEFEEASSTQDALVQA